VPEHASPLVSVRARAAARNSRSPRSPRSPRLAWPRAHRAPLSGPAAILAAAALWGTTGTASTLAPAGAPPAAVGAAGLAAGGLLLLLASHGVRPMLAACTRAQRWLLGLGALAVAGYPVTFYPAVARAGVAVATVIALGSAPVFAGLLAWAAGQGRPGGRWATATGAAVLGCGALVLAPALTGHGGPAAGTGILLAGLAGLCYAGYSLIGRALVAAGHPAAPALGVMFGAAGLAMLPVLLASGTGWLGSWRGPAVALHLAACTTFLAYRLFGRGLRSTSAQVATTLTLAEPTVATLLGVAVLGERLPALAWCGLTVLAVGLACLIAGPPGRRRPGQQLRRSPRAAPPPSRTRRPSRIPIARAMPRRARKG
jgi:drug/metabolite transporter, DME family